MCVTVSCTAPLKIANLHRDSVETITGEVEFSQGEDLTHTFREHTQTVVRQVQALQLRKPKDKRTACRMISTYSKNFHKNKKQLN